MSNVSNQSWAFTIFRVAVGGVFLAHGIQKFFMYGLHGVAGAFASMGVPAPAVTSVLVAVVELLGGAALILGALVGIGLMLEANVMAQPPGDTGAESLRPLAEPKPTRPGPQVIRRIDTAIVDATSA